MFLSAARLREISPTRAVGSVLRRSLDFRGRSGRAEFWWWQAFSLAVGAAVTGLEIWLGVPEVYEGAGWALLAVTVAMTLPGVAVGMRRLHDVGLPGWPVPVTTALFWVPLAVYELGIWTFRLLLSDNRRLVTSMPETMGLDVSPWLAAGLLVANGVLLTLVYVAALLPSRRQSNRWGPSPGMVRQAEVFS